MPLTPIHTKCLVFEVYMLSSTSVNKMHNNSFFSLYCLLMDFKVEQRMKYNFFMISQTFGLKTTVLSLISSLLNHSILSSLKKGNITCDSVWMSDLKF